MTAHQCRFLVRLPKRKPQRDRLIYIRNDSFQKAKMIHAELTSNALFLCITTHLSILLCHRFPCEDTTLVNNAPIPIVYTFRLQLRDRITLLWTPFLQEPLGFRPTRFTHVFTLLMAICSLLITPTYLADKSSSLYRTLCYNRNKP